MSDERFPKITARWPIVVALVCGAFAMALVLAGRSLTVRGLGAASMSVVRPVSSADLAPPVGLFGEELGGNPAYEVPSACYPVSKDVRAFDDCVARAHAAASRSLQLSLVPSPSSYSLAPAPPSAIFPDRSTQDALARINMTLDEIAVGQRAP